MTFYWTLWLKYVFWLNSLAESSQFHGNVVKDHFNCMMLLNKLLFVCTIGTDIFVSTCHRICNHWTCIGTTSYSHLSPNCYKSGSVLACVQQLRGTNVIMTILSYSSPLVTGVITRAFIAIVAIVKRFSTIFIVATAALHCSCRRQRTQQTRP